MRALKPSYGPRDISRMFVSDVYKVNVSQKVHSSGWISVLLVGYCDPNLNYSKFDRNGPTIDIIGVHTLAVKTSSSFVYRIYRYIEVVVQGRGCSGFIIDWTLLMSNRPDSVTKEHLNFISLKILLNRYSIGENKYWTALKFLSYWPIFKNP